MKNLVKRSAVDVIGILLAIALCFPAAIYFGTTPKQRYECEKRGPHVTQAVACMTDIAF